MKYLFIHQNFLGQFQHMARHFARNPKNEVACICHPGKPNMPGVRKFDYTPHRQVTQGIHPYLIRTEAAVINGQSVARVLMQLRQAGWVPDVVIGHPGWGETLFVKDIFPNVPLISFSEFFYRSTGGDFGFDPEFPATEDGALRLRTRTSQHLLALEAADLSYTPTEWQKSQYPEPYHPLIEVVHDGIDTNMVQPDPAATLSLSGGMTLNARDEVITFVSRNLEPYRGFHTFMRALPEILDRRPNAQVVVIGGDEASYGDMPAGGGSWRTKLTAETGLNSDRVHFLGKIPYTQYLQVLQISSAHVYLTYPFVLSWSMLEAMSAECLVVGSRTAPVEEVIEDGVNGVLVDFFDPAGLAAKLDEVLSDPEAYQGLRKQARQTVMDRYELQDCIAKQINLIERVIGKQA